MVRSAEISCSKQFKMQRAGILKSLAFLCALVNLQVLVTSEIDIDFEISGDNAYPLFIGVAPDEKLIKSKAPPHAKDLAERAGYQLGSYKTTTDDGYNLLVHRLYPGLEDIKNASGKPAVLLQHGIAQSSSEWLINDSGKSLAMYLVDNGYDVWIGNARGNKYSNSHTNFEPETMEYFNFTFHEMGIFDFPSTVDLVLRETKQEQINYIGCSIGSTMSFVAISTRPEYTHRIKFIAAISPLAFMSHTKTPLKLLAPHLSEIKTAAVRLNVKRINPETLPIMINKQLGTLCFWRVFSRDLCNSIYKMLDEFGFQRIEEEHLDSLWKYIPTTTSARTCIHIVQLMNSHNEFDKYDYGPDGNAALYGSENPPEYDLSSVTMPVALFTGEEEIFTTSEDTELLVKALPNVVAQVVADSSFKLHTDFTHEAKAVQQIFQPLIEILNTYNKPLS